MLLQQKKMEEQILLIAMSKYYPFGYYQNLCYIGSAIQLISGDGTQDSSQLQKKSQKQYLSHKKQIIQEKHKTYTIKIRNTINAPLKLKHSTLAKAYFLKNLRNKFLVKIQNILEDKKAQNKQLTLYIFYQHVEKSVKSFLKGSTNQLQLSFDDRYDLVSKQLSKLIDYLENIGLKIDLDIRRLGYDEKNGHIKFYIGMEFVWDQSGDQQTLKQYYSQQIVKLHLQMNSCKKISQKRKLSMVDATQAKIQRDSRKSKTPQKHHPLLNQYQQKNQLDKDENSRSNLPLSSNKYSQSDNCSKNWISNFTNNSNKINTIEPQNTSNKQQKLSSDMYSIQLIQLPQEQIDSKINISHITLPKKTNSINKLSKQSKKLKDSQLRLKTSQSHKQTPNKNFSADNKNHINYLTKMQQIIKIYNKLKHNSLKMRTKDQYKKSDNHKDTNNHHSYKNRELKLNKKEYSLYKCKQNSDISKIDKSINKQDDKNRNVPLKLCPQNQFKYHYNLKTPEQIKHQYPKNNSTPSQKQLMDQQVLSEYCRKLSKKQRSNMKKQVQYQELKKCAYLQNQNYTKDFVDILQNSIEICHNPSELYQKKQLVNDRARNAIDNAKKIIQQLKNYRN